MATMLLCLLIMLYLLSCLIITYRARQVPSVVDPYLEGHGDLVSRLIKGITRVIVWLIGVINLLTNSP